MNVTGSKNVGPKLFKEYLRYVRAVSNNNKIETKIILDNLLPEKQLPPIDLNEKMVAELAEMLIGEGYTVERNIGNANYKLPLAVYNKKKDKYILGIEFDYSVFDSSSSILERDVYHPAFMQSRGWNIYRVWSRDWWLSKTKVINALKKKIAKIEKLG